LVDLWLLIAEVEVAELVGVGGELPVHWERRSIVDGALVQRLGFKELLLMKGFRLRS
jgi:hypothetical protein